jgi:hypothetical protein
VVLAVGGGQRLSEIPHHSHEGVDWRDDDPIDEAAQRLMCGSRDSAPACSTR